MVSIVMPVYNGRKLIEASILSILHQSYSNWECIIVDDGSIDSTKEYINDLTSLDNRFRIIHHPYNMGRSAARQTALDAAKGKYLAMLDAEDLWHPNKLETQLKYLENDNNIALVSCSMISFGTSTNILMKRGYKTNTIVHFNGDNIPLHASSLLRTKLAQNYKYDINLSLGEDADFLKRYLKNKYYATQEKALYYYSEFDSVSKNKILKTYKQLLSKFIRDRNYTSIIKMIIKYNLFYISSPFFTIESILKRRGEKPGQSEVDYFETSIRPIINSSIKL